jgi:hypothetical protein
MKNLKKFYQNNRIYCILMIISAICLLIILTSIILYFVSQTKSSKYGHRLDDIVDHPIDVEASELKSYLDNNEKVLSVYTDLRGKILYVNMEVNKDLANEDIQTICTESLVKLTDEQKVYYDIEYIVKREGLNPYIGSKSASRTVISWANFSYNDEEEQTDDEGE